MKSQKERRIYFLLLLIFLIYGAVIYRLFLIQVLKHSTYSALAQDQNQIFKKLIPNRGEIFAQDKNLTFFPLAINREYPAVYLVPREISDKENLAQKLSEILGIDKETILNKAGKIDDPYEPLKSKIDDASAQKIQELDLEGVYLTSENSRWYPEKNLTSHLVGFLGYKDDERVGQYGLEGYYNQDLSGQAGILKTTKDAQGTSILMGDYDLEPAKDGGSLYLTIDPNIQFVAAQKLKAVLEKWQSSSGSVIVMDPKTGAILAMASFPDFDSNEYSKVENIDDFLNPITQKLYEPGSVFKPITMAAGLDSGKVSPETTYVDTGSLEIGGYLITNAADRSYGLSNMTKVLEKSINTGVVFAQRKTGNEIFKNYVEAFGFNGPTGVDLAGEVAGNINNLKENKEINFATAAFGQGIAVTPLEMAAAICAIANEGKMMRPYLVEKIVYPDGREEKTEPQAIRQVVSEQTANKLTAMLVSTVRNGYDKIKIKGYFIAGKTGTAQVPSEDQRGYSDETIHTFIGYAPAYNPKFLVFIKMDKPKGINFASDSLGPVFAEIAKYLFNYYEIPPDEQ
ncbi:MAG: penicillin-binding protein 2 [Candidatus Portnoybacteria bacterium]|nr:penicillin-binding protein 2 [Candidatus Portnoybacteria bacterium]